MKDANRQEGRSSTYLIHSKVQGAKLSFIVLSISHGEDGFHFLITEFSGDIDSEVSSCMSFEVLHWCLLYERSTGRTANHLVTITVSKSEHSN
jgi:hypothetical protein